ncbi:pyridoxamine 5'-phosphate oxidase family protein [Mycolicibacterium arenosum]|uniref:Pyridoxamine 5'-phosphate oxidase family protein n=1 Tax=Mycolicibacterium arenosum TaxID=2952157 RepID=A0ABT1LWX0_9MYCO|nr:pyridoxamine 5'-phosphate oxidase family protein [Mycolicibacterium sp. CAU 1645]MCP9270840.1 pyridoxamine 5'-phosphate oxidase family protein [Mycolicibacterium sp. CAU 1645]
MPNATRNLDGYNSPPIEWDAVEQQLKTNVPQAPGTGGPSRHTAWLTTIGASGVPHVRPLGVVSVDGVWYFNSSAETRKSRNLAHDGRCVLCLATDPFDLVLEGTATRVTGGPELDAVATALADDWPCEVDGDALTAEFSAPSGGKPPYYVFRMDPTTVYAFGTREPYGATRYDL